MMPGDARSAEDLEIARIERQIVEHHIAVVDAECGTACQCPGDDVVAQVGELGTVLGLRVGHAARRRNERSRPGG
jgi:hypothetical protein